MPVATTRSFQSPRLTLADDWYFVSVLYPTDPVCPQPPYIRQQPTSTRIVFDL